MSVKLHYVLVLASCIVRVTQAIECMSCDDVLFPEHCNTTATCGKDYTCTALGPYNSAYGGFCIECCGTEHCNKRLCSKETKSTTTQRPVTTRKQTTAPTFSSTTVKPTTQEPTSTTQQPKPTTQRPKPTLNTSTHNIWTQIGHTVTVICFGRNTDSLTAIGQDIVTENSSSTYLRLAVHVTSDKTIFCLGQTQDGQSVTQAIHIHVFQTSMPSTTATTTTQSTTTIRPTHRPYVSTSTTHISLPWGSNRTISCRGHHVDSVRAVRQDSQGILSEMKPKLKHSHLIEVEVIALTDFNVKCVGIKGGAVVTTTTIHITVIGGPTTTPVPVTTSLATTSTEFMIKPAITLDKQLIIPEGQPTTAIHCKVHGIPKPNITWDTIDHHFPSNVQQMGNYLLIYNAGVYDSTYYICKAQNKAGSAVKVINVIINQKEKPTTEVPHIPPTIHLTPLTEVQYGSSVSLTCNATGYPTPKITWHANHKTIRQKVVKISSATLSNNGIYVCIATNDAGHTQATTLLTVTGDSPHISVPPTSVAATAGSSVKFSCHATGVPPPSITWTYTSFSQASRKLPAHTTSLDGNSLTLLHTDTYESGTIKCTATNPYGSANAQANLLVQNPNSPLVGK